MGLRMICSSCLCLISYTNYHLKTNCITWIPTIASTIKIGCFQNILQDTVNKNYLHFSSFAVHRTIILLFNWNLKITVLIKCTSIKCCYNISRIVKKISLSRKWPCHKIFSFHGKTRTKPVASHIFRCLSILTALCITCKNIQLPGFPSAILTSFSWFPSEVPVLLRLDLKSHAIIILTIIITIRIIIIIIISVMVKHNIQTHTSKSFYLIH